MQYLLFIPASSGGVRGSPEQVNRWCKTRVLKTRSIFAVASMKFTAPSRWIDPDDESVFVAPGCFTALRCAVRGDDAIKRVLPPISRAKEEFASLAPRTVIVPDGVAPSLSSPSSCTALEAVSVVAAASTIFPGCLDYASAEPRQRVTRALRKSGSNDDFGQALGVAGAPNASEMLRCFRSVKSWGRCAAGELATAGYGAGCYLQVPEPSDSFARLSKRSPHYISVAVFPIDATEWGSEVEILLKAERMISMCLHG